MVTALDWDLFQATLYFLEDYGHRFPHATFPGVRPDGILRLNTKAEWDAWIWNPEPSDPNAGRKPSWGAIVAASESVALTMARESKAIAVSDEFRARCNRLFGAKDDRNEIWARFAGTNTPENVAERNRLYETQRFLRTLVQDMSMTELEAFEPTADSWWNPLPT